MADGDTESLLLFDLDESNRYGQQDGTVKVKPSSKSQARAGDKRVLSMIDGVFMPCVLAIFSGIPFLRVGFAIGQGGMLATYGMFIIGYIIVTLTTLSLSAISTNGAVKCGGVYFMISRALGPEFGGSVAVVFSLANIFSASLYCIGFTETLTDSFGEGGVFVDDDTTFVLSTDHWYLLGYSSSILLICVIVCIIGPEMFAKIGLSRSFEGVFVDDDTTFVLPTDHWYLLGYSSFVLLICLIVCIIGPEMFAKTQLIIFLTVMSAFLSIFISFGGKDPESFEHHGVTANYTGVDRQTFRDNLYSNYTVDYTTGEVQNFVAVFAVIFNGCVGIMTGANLSGELKNPSKAIPVGTLGALVYTSTIYITLIMMISFTCSRELLVNNYNFLLDINLVPPLIATGIFAATLSASLSALIGASRVVIALANDNLLGPILWPVQKLVTKGGNPIGAVLICWLIAQIILFLGALNTIAPIVSIFFMLSYASVNVACLALDLASAPNFRPTFKFFAWPTSLLGMLGSLLMMFLISPLYATISIAIFLILLIVIHLIGGDSQWGYISQALIFHQVRKYLLLLDTRKDHVKFWRPQILLLVANPRSSCGLIRFVNDMKKSGLYVIGHVKQGTLDQFPTDPVEWEQPAWLKLVETLKIKAFVELTLAQSIREGAQHLTRISGLGGMKPNMVVMGFYDDILPEDSLAPLIEPRQGSSYGTVTEDDENANVLVQLPPLRAEGDDKLISPEEYVSIVLDLIRLRKGVCLARNFHNFDRDALGKAGQKRDIDVWPVNFLKPETAGYFDTSCIFILQVACVVNMVPYWRKNSRMRIFLCVDGDQASTNHKRAKLEKFLAELRIKAEIVTVMWNHITLINSSSGDQTDEGKEEPSLETTATGWVSQVSEDYLQALNSMVGDYARDTEVVFSYLPMPPVDRDLHGQYLHVMDVLTRDLPPTMMLHGETEVTLTSL